MKRIGKRLTGLLLTLSMALCLTIPTYAAQNTELEAVLADTAQVLTEAVPTPQVGSIGGEWTVLGLARSGCAVPEGYYQGYYDALADHVAKCGGVLHQRKYTEYSRVILALSALGVDARNVAGYDLTAPLKDYDQTAWQGVNGPIYALLALDSRNYPAPRELRQRYVDYILSCQLPDGGWSLSGTVSDPDMTGMALQALAKYREQPAVAQAAEKALDCMAKQQSADGGFSTWGTATSESCGQIIVALCELGIPLEDPQFVKEGHTLLDGLLLYYEPGAGFRHTLVDTSCSQMATEQAFYALAALKRAREGQDSLYRMDDAGKLAGASAQATPNVIIRTVLWSALAAVDLPKSKLTSDVLAKIWMGGK